MSVIQINPKYGCDMCGAAVCVGHTPVNGYDCEQLPKGTAPYYIDGYFNLWLNQKHNSKREKAMSDT
jgi:hypothetical protein